tara:strand:+ start:526 stop:825 length:300 start_codon:yes stop_codon:yes gene_type:complete
MSKIIDDLWNIHAEENNEILFKVKYLPPSNNDPARIEMLNSKTLKTHAIYTPRTTIYIEGIKFDFISVAACMRVAINWVIESYQIVHVDYDKKHVLVKK